MTLDQEKQHLRETAGKIRAQAFRDAGPAAVAAVNARVGSLVGAWTVGTVSGYLAIGDEMDICPALANLSAQGWRTGLPVVVARDTPLIFRAWKDGEALEKGTFGTRHPKIDAEIVPTHLLVPMLAFDRAGYRMGWGGGFYDRTLAKLRAGNPDTVAIGVAYAVQKVDAMPRDQYDQQLDWIVTDQETIHIGRGQ